ncbi:MAG: SnoaL-like domain [Solirubrobacterales bacterium]|jgi:ketosteroid isomerase-like protein|nr:SnoaL-like domain [Solirubrobacterales bacterium]
METNLETYQRILETFNREGVDGVLHFFTDDVEVYDPDLPSGSYRGPEGARRVVEMLSSGFEDVEVRDFRLLPAGDRVVALLHTHSKGERDDIEMDVHDAHTITFRDGKISYWRLYIDQAEALTDAGLDPELASAGSS